MPDAIRSTLAASAADAWLTGLTAPDRPDIDHETVERSIAAAKDELRGDA